MTDTTTYIEPIFYHDDVKGWHHHHSEAGAIIHLDEASGHAIDTDGSTVVFSAHLADHESLPNVDAACLDEGCSFASLTNILDDIAEFVANYEEPADDEAAAKAERETE